jgi:PAS domain S-box-containing protein
MKNHDKSKKQLIEELTTLRRRVATLEKKAKSIKQSEQTLRFSEQKFRTSFHLNPNPSAICSLKDFTFIDVNRAFTKNLGYRRDEIIGKSPLDLKEWQKVFDWKEMGKKLAEGKKIRIIEKEITDMSGKRHIGLISAEIIMINEEPHVLAVANDITGIRRAEKNY